MPKTISITSFNPDSELYTYQKHLNIIALEGETITLIVIHILHNE